MKIWTGNFFLLLLLCGSLVLLARCASQEHKPGQKETAASGKDTAPEDEVSLKSDRAAIEELRKDIPIEIKKSNDRLAETLARWKASKMDPDRLREKFNDEIRKMREAMDKKQKKSREDFQRDLADKRTKFLDSLKSERDSFYAGKPKSEQRSDFSSKQSSARDRYFGDERDIRADFDGNIKDERREFEDDVSSRWVEFRQEFPEYSRLYREMKEKENKEHEANLLNPKPSGGPWPYKYPGEENQPEPAASQPNVAPATPNATGPSGNENGDVNKGGNGWPSSDPNEFDQIPGKKSGLKKFGRSSAGLGAI